MRHHGRSINLPEEANGAPLTGVVVTEVVEGSPAAERGLEPGDVIRRINQKPIARIADLIDGVNEVRDQEKSSFLLLVRVVIVNVSSRCRWNDLPLTTANPL